MLTHKANPYLHEKALVVKTVLLLLFSCILVGMLFITTYASLDRGITEVGQELLADRWFQATLLDAYFGFLTFYAWVFYKETSNAKRAIWFVLVMLLGNIAMSIYMLIQLSRWNAVDGVSALLLREGAAPTG